MIERFWRSAHSVRQTLLDLLFPPRCVICGSADVDWYCAPCRSKIDRILPPLCVHCGRPLDRQACSYCRTAPLEIDGIRAIAFFEGNLRKAIHAFKYKHRPELVRVLGSLVSEYISIHPLPADVITAVPLHTVRERSRGYNQSLLLARFLGAQTNLPVWENALTRIRATQPQTQLNAVERIANVQGAFASDTRVAGRRILLIDDVCTTGATMNACSVALKQCGVRSVWGLALARGR
jgi:ComF family protein